MGGFLLRALTMRLKTWKRRGDCFTSPLREPSSTSISPVRRASTKAELVVFARFFVSGADPFNYHYPRHSCRRVSRRDGGKF